MQRDAGAHTNVLPVLGAFRVHDQTVIVFELVADGSLAECLARRNGVGLPIGDALALTEGIRHGVVHVRGHPIARCDLKPANILLQGRTPRLADLLRCVTDKGHIPAMSWDTRHCAPWLGHRALGGRNRARNPSVSTGEHGSGEPGEAG